jgi:hypothetical protein
MALRAGSEGVAVAVEFDAPALFRAVVCVAGNFWTGETFF